MRRTGAPSIVEFLPLRPSAPSRAGEDEHRRDRRAAGTELEQGFNGDGPVVSYLTNIETTELKRHDALPNCRPRGTHLAGHAQLDAGRDYVQHQRSRNRSARGVAMIVRCIDNTLQRDTLVVGRKYEVRAERDDCYILSGFDKRFSKTRFEIVERCAVG